MSQKDLIPIQTTARAKELGSKGGKTVTDRQRYAQKWRQYKKRLKTGKIESDNPQWLMDRVEDDKSFAVDMLKDIDKLEKIPGYPKDKLVFLKNQIYKSLHGTKISGEIKHQHELRAVVYNISDSNDKYPKLEPKED